MADGQCSTCGSATVRTGKPGAPRKYCSRKCRDRHRNRTETGRARLARQRAAAKARGRSDSQKSRERQRNKRRYEYLNARKRRLWDRWLNAKRQGDARSLEEYAEFDERRILKCSNAHAWAEWVRRPSKPRPTSVSSSDRYRMRYRDDPAFRLKERMRRQFKKWLSGGRKARPSFLAGLDYSWEELRAHIESQFVAGMGWHNSGAWHIDHIVPKSSFDPSDANQVRACWALGNLRPLWAEQNLAKGAKHVFLV